MSRHLFNIFFLVSVVQTTFCTVKGQNNFHKFTNELKELNLPFVIDIINFPDTIVINRQQSWDYLILQTTVLNKLKTDSTTFPIDTNIIIEYKQWDNLDLQKKEGIEIYSPTLNGRLYCIGTINVNANVIGIIWSFYQQDFLYGTGPIHYYCTYDNNGKLLDFLEININQTGTTGLEDYEIHSKTDISNSEVKIKKTMTYFESNKNKKLINRTVTNQTFHIADNGIFQLTTK